MDTEQQLAKTLGIPYAIGQVILGTHRINFLKAGSGEPLLLIHGANFGWGMWYPNISRLAECFTVYAIDLPGAGRSSRINYAALDPQRDFADTVLEFIHRMGLTSFHLIGHSIGGWVALRIALENPDMVCRLVLVDSVGFTDSAAMPEKALQQYAFAKLVSRTILLPRRGNGIFGKFLHSAFRRSDTDLSHEFLDYVFETMRTSHNLLLISRLIKLRKILLLTGRLSEIKNKTLVIWGEQDPIVPLGLCRVAIDRIPDVRVEVMSGVGHVPGLEDRKTFNDILLDFLSAGC